MLSDWFLEDYPDGFYFASLQLALPASFWSWRLASGNTFSLINDYSAAELCSGSLVSLDWLKQQHTKKQETSIFINQNQIRLPLYNIHYCLNVDTVTISLETSSWFVSV